MKKTLIVLLTTLVCASCVLSDTTNVSARVVENNYKNQSLSNNGNDINSEEKSLEEGTSDKSKGDTSEKDKTDDKTSDKTDSEVEEVKNSSGTFEVKKDTIIKYTGDASEVEIPVKSSKQEIMKIGDNAFKGNTSVKKVITSEKINYIGDSAFEGCSNLEEVELKGCKVSINKKAFLKCTKLKNINMDNVLYIADYAFYGDTSLDEVNFCNGLGIGAYAFAYSSVKKANISSGEFPVSIDSCAFLNCKSLEEVCLGGKANGASDRAFYGCSNLEKVDTKNAAEQQSYGKDVFEGTKWLEDKLKESNMVILGHCLVKYNAKEYYIPVSYYENNRYKVDEVSGEEYKEKLIPKKEDLKEFETVDLPEDVQALSSGVFYGAYSVDKINFSCKNMSISDKTFDYTKWEKNILNTENMIVLSGYLYKVNNQAEEIVTPSNIIAINDTAFPSENNKIKKITITKNVNTYEQNWFNTRYDSVTMPSKFQKKANSKYLDKDNLEFKDVEADTKVWDFTRDGNYDYSKIKEADYDEDAESKKEDPQQGNKDPEQGKKDSEQGKKDPEQGKKDPEQGNKDPEQGKKDQEQGKKDPQQGNKDSEEGKKDSEQGKKDSEEGKKDPEQGKKDPEEGKKDSEQGKKDPEEGDKKTNQDNTEKINITDFKSESGSSAKEGDNAIFNVKAQGKEGELLYQFTVDNNIVQAYGSKSSFEWTAKGVGKHQVEVSVKDEKGNTLSKDLEINIIEVAKADDTQANNGGSKTKEDKTKEGDHSGIELTGALMMFAISSFILPKKKKLN